MKNLGLMVQYIKDNTKMDLRRVKVNLDLLMVATTRECSLKTKYKAEARIVGQMAKYTLVSGLKTKCTEKVF